MAGDAPLMMDVMGWQTVAGFRGPGPLLGALSGGGDSGEEGINLTPQARRVLHAQQILHGHRAPGQLVAGLTLPLGELPRSTLARTPAGRTQATPPLPTPIRWQRPPTLF